MRKLKRSGCEVFPLVLKYRWFDMIALGQKKEEYRDPSKYWRTRFDNWQKRARASGGPMVVEFRRGHAARAQRAAFLLADMFLRAAYRFEHPDWGEPCGEHFVLRLGERVMLEEGGEE